MNNPDQAVKTTRRPKASAAATNKPTVSRKPIAMGRQTLAAPVSKRAVSTQSSPAGIFAPLLNLFQRLTKQFLERRNRPGKLEIHEIQQLGEKRFVAIVRVGKQKFLIGGAATSVSLLAEINSDKTAMITPRPLGRERA